MKTPPVSMNTESKMALVHEDESHEQKIIELGKMIAALSEEVEREEADKVARIAVLYPYHLGRSYKLVRPARLHNFLITLGMRERGLCYHWAEDMMKRFAQERYRSMDFHRIVSEEGNMNEHHALVVTAKGKSVEEGLVLDAWRDSSVLYFSKYTDDDDYRWKPNSFYKVLKARE